jgi:hypothetical protein
VRLRARGDGACACVEIVRVFLRPTTSRCRCESVVVRRGWRFREVITRSVASSKSREGVE